MSEVHGGDITKRTLEVLQAYDWPGNVRELQNVDSEKLAQKTLSVVLKNDVP
jgi:DNA-binding NtrC family response regulator